MKSICALMVAVTMGFFFGSTAGAAPANLVGTWTGTRTEFSCVYDHTTKAFVGGPQEVTKPVTIIISYQSQDGLFLGQFNWGPGFSPFSGFVSGGEVTIPGSIKGRLIFSEGKISMRLYSAFSDGNIENKSTEISVVMKLSKTN